MGDVIDLKGRKLVSTENLEKVETEKSSILDISSIRKEMIKEERRQARRTILNGFIGAHVVIPGRGLLRISLYDVSSNGLSFEVNPEWGQFQEKEDVAMRFYFSQKVYFPFLVRITGGRVLTPEGLYRHGAAFVPDISNSDAISHFVNFLESVSSALKTDSGDIFISSSGV